MWVIDHPISMPGGIEIGTRTTLIRLSNGSFFVHGLRPIEEGDHAEVAALGEVMHRVAPNLFHNAYVKDWVARSPDATCYAPARFDTKVKDKAAIRRGIARILEWDFDRMTVTHGEVLESGGHTKFRQAYSWLLE